MDDADRAFRNDQWMMRAALQSTRRCEGPKPRLVSLCLFCGKEIDHVPATAEGIKKARRWCNADCRDAWAKEHEHE